MISEQERAWEREADEYRATEVRTMETVIWITVETADDSFDVELTVGVEIDAYGVRPAEFGVDRFGGEYLLSKAQQDRAADQAWEEAHEE